MIPERLAEIAEDAMTDSRALDYATWRLMQASTSSTPVPDRATEVADLRAALSIACGREVADICPATGYDLSARAYRTVRDEWREVTSAGPLHRHMADGYLRARAIWAAAQPGLIHDWPAAEFNPEVTQ